MAGGCHQHHPGALDEITAKLTAAGMTGLVIWGRDGCSSSFLEQNRQLRWDYVDQELMERMRGSPG